MRDDLYRNNVGGYGKKVHYSRFGLTASCGKRVTSSRFVTRVMESVDCIRCLQIHKVRR